MTSTSSERFHHLTIAELQHILVGLIAQRHAALQTSPIIDDLIAEVSAALDKAIAQEEARSQA